jgi:hypothetical protein
VFTTACPPFAAQHDEQIRHHCRLALFIQMHNALLAEHVQRHLYHADGAFDDLAARGDDRRSLLPLQHQERTLRISAATCRPKT